MPSCQKTVNEEQKLEIYKRIASISSSADVEDVREELMDRFGKIPLPAQNLLRVALIRSVAGLLEIEELTGGGGSLRIVLQARARGIRAEQIPVLVKEYRGRLSFMIKEKPQFQLRYPVSGKTIKDEETLLMQLLYNLYAAIYTAIYAVIYATFYAAFCRSLLRFFTALFMRHPDSRECPHR